MHQRVKAVWRCRVNLDFTRTRAELGKEDMRMYKKIQIDDRLYRDVEL